MVGASLSKWTMSYFAAALLALIAAEGLMVAGFGFPNAPIRGPETLVLVHLVAIGWLSMLMLGALFQFVPVLVVRPLHSNGLPLPSLMLILSGLAALLLGFLQLGGYLVLPHSCFPTASALLGAGVSLALWNLGRTLWAARPLPISARFVTVGLASIAVTALLGILFALTLGGVVSHPALLAIASQGVPVHAIVGLGGWLTFTAMGVSYRLLAMFMLAPELDGASTRAAFHFGAAALALVIFGGVGLILLGGHLALALAAAGALGLACVAIYWKDMVHLYRARKRRVIELNSRMAGLALISLGLAAALAFAATVFGVLPRLAGAVAFLTAFGWLSGLGLAMLYKIVAFVTWLECYGPVLGKMPTPRVQDLVMERRALPWFMIYFVAVWSGTVALLIDQATVFRLCAGAMTIATVGLCIQFMHTRRLDHVLMLTSLPESGRPRLLMSVT